MTVRCKFTCMDKTENTDGVEVTFSPVTSGSAENERFFSFTPWGELKFGTFNEDAAAQFEVGKEYYVDVSAVPA